MRRAVPGTVRPLFLLTLSCALSCSQSPRVEPEAVGLSSARLAEVTAILQKEVAANHIAGAVALVARKGRVAYLQAGAGIVADSDPASEHRECLNKLAALEHAIDVAEAET